MNIHPEPRRPSGGPRQCVIETLEAILVAAADAGGDWRLVAAEHQLTGAGQTVVIIDSGIAYDHVALGGGAGTDRRYVGGWDFAENDADPYDDGPMGSHGTHIAGIIASTHSTAVGVAPGVDLAALRVFDDDGNSDLSWIERALDWVHEHRMAFRSPITTVNLSIGMRWNGASVPDWTIIEDELAILEADGIFTAVAAGNGFAQHENAGLNYPAASPLVVPVMSVDADGGLSAFSQRHERGIAAPGRQIRSTVPDYAGNFNSRADDFAVYTGTSMATPFVAGASVIIRQAMERSGIGISQDAINAVLRNTADTVFDPITGQSYLRLNLSRAIDSVTPDEPNTPQETTQPTAIVQTPTTTETTIVTTDPAVDSVSPTPPLQPRERLIYRIPALRPKSSHALRRADDFLSGDATVAAGTTTLTAGRVPIRVRRMSISAEHDAASFDAVHAEEERAGTHVAAADKVYKQLGGDRA
jgi:subtilisin family serine protease